VTPLSRVLVRSWKRPTSTKSAVSPNETPWRDTKLIVPSRAADPEKMLKCCYDKHICVKVPKKPKCDSCHKKDDDKKDEHKKDDKKDDKKEEKH
jgi:hypothetical protein